MEDLKVIFRSRFDAERSVEPSVDGFGDLQVETREMDPVGREQDRPSSVSRIAVYNGAGRPADRW